MGQRIYCLLPLSASKWANWYEGWCLVEAYRGSCHSFFPIVAIALVLWIFTGKFILWPWNRSLPKREDWDDENTPIKLTLECLYPSRRIWSPSVISIAYMSLTWWDVPSYSSWRTFTQNPNQNSRYLFLWGHSRISLGYNLLKDPASPTFRVFFQFT